MSCLESLLEIEKKLENRLLSENYDSLTEETGDECSSLIVEYIKSTDSLINRDIRFVNKLARVTDNLVKSTSLLDGELEKIYKLCNELYSNFKPDEIKIPSETKTKIISNIKELAANAAEKMYDQTKDAEWLEKSYELNIDAAELSVETNPEFSCARLDSAFHVAKNMHHLIGEKRWAEKKYETVKLKIEILNRNNLPILNHTKSYFADALKTFGNVTNDIKLLKKSYETSLEIINDKEDFHTDCYFYALKRLGELSEFFYCIDLDNAWREKSLNYLELACEIGESTEPEMIPYLHKGAGNISHNLYAETNDIKFAKKAYNHFSESAQRLEKSDKKTSAHTHSYACKMALELFNLNGDDEMGRNAIFHYSQFSKYCKNSDNGSIKPVRDTLLKKIETIKHKLAS